jgi:YspA, cpYpsA-related SLOG family
MKYAVVGSRTFDDKDLLAHWLKFWIHPFDTIISGGAIGADRLAAQWAKTISVDLIEYKPDWELYGKRAGFIRNEKIIGEADVIIAFWDGVSPGTKHDLNLAKQAKKPTFIIYF